MKRLLTSMEHDEYGKMLYDVYGIIGVQSQDIKSIAEQATSAYKKLDSLPMDLRSELSEVAIALSVIQGYCEHILQYNDKPIGQYD